MHLKGLKAQTVDGLMGINIQTIGKSMVKQLLRAIIFRQDQKLPEIEEKKLPKLTSENARFETTRYKTRKRSSGFMSRESSWSS